MKSMNRNKVVKGDLIIIAESLAGVSDNFDGKSVLITGGAGFLGKYIVFTLDYLNKNVLKVPCKIIVIDNFITGSKGVFDSVENLEILEADICKPMKVEFDVDYILHAASIAAPVFYNKYRLETMDTG